MNDEQEPEPVEITITARDAMGASASADFEYTPSKPGVEEAVDELIHGFIGRVDQRITDIQSEE